MKLIAWTAFGLCSAFLLIGNILDIVRVWSIVLHNPYGFSYLTPGDPTTPGIPYVVLALRPTVSFVVSTGALVLTTRHFFSTHTNHA